MCRAEQGRKGRKRDGGGQSLSQQEGIFNEGMEDTPGDVAIVKASGGVGLRTFSCGS